MSVIINTEPQYVATYDGRPSAYVFRLYATLNSQDITNNTSNITVTAYAYGRNGWGYNGFYTPTETIYVNGENKASATVSSIPTSGAEVTLCTWTGNIQHNADGSRAISVTASYAPNTSAYYYVPKANNVSATATLTTIPRASVPSVSNYTITNTTGSLTYTVTSRADFYHKAIWTLEGSSTTVTLGEIDTTTSSFTIANTALLSKLPAQASGSLSIEIQTFTDSGYTNQIGTSTTSATITVDTSAIKPTVSLGNIAINTSPHNTITVPVAGYSTLKSTYTTTRGNGASGVTTYFTASHGSMATATSTTTTGTATTGTLPASTSNYTFTLSAYAKDSRGAVSSTVSQTITVYGYSAPTATLSAYRTETSSSTAEDGAGLFVYVTFSGAMGASVNNQNSIQTTVCTYSGSISGTATNGAHYALADNQSVTFTLTVTDKITSSSAVASVAPAAYPLDLYDDGQGTVGAAIGGVAPAGGFAVFVDLHLYEGQKIIIHKTGGTTEVHDVSELFS